MTDYTKSINLYDNSAYVWKTHAFLNMHHEENHAC